MKSRLLLLAHSGRRDSVSTSLVIEAERTFATRSANAHTNPLRGYTIRRWKLLGATGRANVSATASPSSGLKATSMLPGDCETQPSALGGG
jgi:hypothetical protein